MRPLVFEDACCVDLDSYGSKWPSVGTMKRSRFVSSSSGLFRSRQQKCGMSAYY